MTAGAYIICTSPRSGSTLLCKLLQEAGTAGHPDSHFHAPSLEKWRGYYDLNGDLNGAAFGSNVEMLEAIFQRAIARGQVDSGIFGLRMQRHSFPFFLDQLRVLFPAAHTDAARIAAAFGAPLYIHLTRENKLDQAISYVKAEQSGLWHRAADGSELERLSAPKDPVYDGAAIAAQRAASVQMDEEWHAWFEAQEIAPLRITYEALSAAPYGTLGRVMTALGLKTTAQKETAPPVAKLADAVNAEWAARFRADGGDA